MSYIREFFRESNKIEGVESDEAIQKNIDAFEYLSSLDEDELFSHKAMKKAHQIIMEDRQPEIAGEYKEEKNFVMLDRKVKYFTPPEKVREKIEQLMKNKPETGLQALKFKLTATNIHPFRDGNGRVLRCYYAAICQEVVGCYPLIFHAENRKGYYDLCNSTKNLYVNPEVKFETYGMSNL